MPAPLRFILLPDLEDGQGRVAVAEADACPAVEEAALSPAVGVCHADLPPAARGSAPEPRQARGSAPAPPLCARDFEPRQDNCGLGAPAPPGRDDLCTPLTYGRDQTLAQALFLSGAISPPVLCSGLARCGRCRVRILSSPEALPPLPAERALFSDAELDQGLRLACRRKPLPGLRLELAPTAGACARRALAPAPARPVADPGPDPAAPVLAVDLGTTSLQWLLADARGRTLAAGSRINPQMGAGSDVLSRVGAARSPGGLRRLYELTLGALLEIVEKLPQGPGRICLAANPAMSAIALGLDPSGLAAAPYALPEKGGRWFALPQLPPLWLPPQLSPFVGGDIAAGYAALTHDSPLTGGGDIMSLTALEIPPPVCPWLLADLGTNGEFLLVLAPDRCLAASAPMGPALEGAGLAQGSEARPGAATDFRLGPKGLETGVLDAEGRVLFHTPERTPLLAGITGTGALALLHLLAQCGLMDRQGRFVPPSGGPLARSLVFGRNKRGEAELALPGGLRLCAGEVEELLKVKAAFSLALSRLLQQAGLEARRLTALYLAGALGRYLRKEALAGLGFLPPGLQGRAISVGNAALEGALLLGADPKARARVLDWRAKARALDLAGDPAFGNDYPRHMNFTWIA